jgi:hypothetical protein
MPPKKTTKAAAAVAPKARRSEEDHVPDSNAENVPPIPPPTLEMKYDPETIRMILRDLEDRMEAKCLQIQKETEFMATSLQQAFHLELIKIPTQVKQMPLSVFRDEYGESIEAVTRGAIMNKNAAMEVPRGVSTKIRASSSANKAFQTPVGKTRAAGLAIPAATPSRNPRQGETILSKNGSPLGTFQTAVKAPRANNSVIPPTPGVYVPLSSGEVVDLETITALPEEQRQDALLKMQQMMESMQSLMKQMEKATNAPHA